MRQILCMIVFVEAQTAYAVEKVDFAFLEKAFCNNKD